METNSGEHDPRDIRISELEAQLAESHRLIEQFRESTAELEARLEATEARIVISNETIKGNNEELDANKSALQSSRSLNEQAAGLLSNREEPKTVVEPTPGTDEQPTAVKPAPARSRRAAGAVSAAQVKETRSEKVETKRGGRFGTAAVIGGMAVAAVAGFLLGTTNKDRSNNAAITQLAPAANESDLVKNLGTLPASPAKAPVAKAASTSTANQAPKLHLGNTIDSAVKHIETHTDAQFRAFVKKSFANPDQYKVHVSHNGDRVDSLDSMHKNANTNDLREAAWLGVLSDPSVVSSYWNNMHHKDSGTPIPANVSHQEQLNDLYRLFSSQDLKTANVRLNGLYANGAISQHDGHRYDVPTAFRNVRAVLIEANGTKLLIKVGGGSDGNKPVCLNPELMRHITITPETPQTPSTHTSQPHGTPQTPGTPVTHPHKTPHTPGTTIHHPHKPIHHEKHDDNTTPAGVPGEPKGSGGNGPEKTRPQAGPAPANVGQEQQTTPAPVTTTETTQTSGNEQTGQDQSTGNADQSGEAHDTTHGTIDSTNTPPPPAQ